MKSNISTHNLLIPEDTYIILLQIKTRRRLLSFFLGLSKKKCQNRFYLGISPIFFDKEVLYNCYNIILLSKAIEQFVILHEEYLLFPYTTIHRSLDDCYSFTPQLLNYLVEILIRNFVQEIWTVVAKIHHKNPELQLFVDC